MTMKSSNRNRNRPGMSMIRIVLFPSIIVFVVYWNAIKIVRLIQAANTSHQVVSLGKRQGAKEEPKRVAVLGGGIQGCAMAMLFRRYGYDVTIFDQAPDVLERASSSQEGKIHLGMVYSHDKTLKTGRNLLASALRFGGYMDYLLDKSVEWSTMVSTNFRYLVPFDSLLSPDEIEAFFTKLEKLYLDMIQVDDSLAYLGERPDRLYARINVPSDVNTTYFAAAFDTVERSVSQNRLKSLIKQRLEQQSVRIILNTRVTNVHRQQDMFQIQTSQGEYLSHIVVNCLWESRHMIDKGVGIPQWSGENVRLKFGIKTDYSQELAAMPSTTIVNGPFGDYVNYPIDEKMYFSWYPVALHGMIANQDIPTEWEQIAGHNIPQALRERQITEQQARFKQLFLTDFEFKSPNLIAGFILGNGDKDVHHTDSKLHSRADDPIYHDRCFFSISTQKYTSAPYNAYLLENTFLKEADAFELCSHLKDRNVDHVTGRSML